MNTSPFDLSRPSQSHSAVAPLTEAPPDGPAHGAAPTRAVPSSLQAVIDRVAADLAALQVPDLDLAVLQAAAVDVDAGAAAVRAAESALAAARDVLSARLDTLSHKCARAVAYARVYAEDNSDLSGKLDALEVARPARPRGLSAVQSGGPMPAAARGRGRPRKNPGPDDSLFIAAPAADTSLPSHAA